MDSASFQSGKMNMEIPFPEAVHHVSAKLNVVVEPSHCGQEVDEATNNRFPAGTTLIGCNGEFSDERQEHPLGCFAFVEQ